MVLSACFCCYSNFCSIFAIESFTLSPISSKSPSVKVIGSSDDLVAFDFFHYPSFSAPCTNSLGGECSPVDLRCLALTTLLPSFGAKETSNIFQSYALPALPVPSRHALLLWGPSPHPISSSFQPTTKPSAWSCPFSISPWIC